jgi:hypothetical protein
MEEELANAIMFTRRRRRMILEAQCVSSDKDIPLVGSAAGGAFGHWLDNPDRLRMPTVDWGGIHPSTSQLW